MNLDLDRLLRYCLWGAAALASAALWWPSTADAARIKEVASIQGVRPNQLVGYGLVVGLDGTGDQTTQAPFTTQSLNSMLQQLGVTVPASVAATMQLKNVAAVLVTANLPAFAQPGQQIDVDVSSVGNAKSLRGGTLVVTPLKGADGQIYAMAQGNLIVGGAGAAAGGSKVTINHLSAGPIPEGAPAARAVAASINTAKGAGVARAVDGRVVNVRAPVDPDQRVGFMADIENLDIAMATPAAKVVLNARTGSIVMNQAVTLNACAVAHGSLSVTINSNPQVSQPAPL